MDFTESDLKETARYCGGEALVLLREPKMLKATFDVLKAVLNEKPDVVGAVSAVASAGATAAGKSTISGEAKILTKSGSATLSIFKATLNMSKAAKLTSVSGVLAFAGATVIQKSGIALSLAGDDNERAKCYGALMELAGNATATAIVGFGSGGILIGLTLASLAMSAVNAYGTCNGILWKK
jgi:N-acyl-L-homoserine lactone synthetase